MPLLIGVILGWGGGLRGHRPPHFSLFCWSVNVIMLVFLQDLKRRALNHFPECIILSRHANIEKFPPPPHAMIA